MQNIITSLEDKIEKVGRKAESLKQYVIELQEIKKDLERISENL